MQKLHEERTPKLVLQMFTGHEIGKLSEIRLMHLKSCKLNILRILYAGSARQKRRRFLITEEKKLSKHINVVVGFPPKRKD